MELSYIVKNYLKSFIIKLSKLDKKNIYFLRNLAYSFFINKGKDKNNMEGTSSLVCSEKKCVDYLNNNKSRNPLHFVLNFFSKQKIVQTCLEARKWQELNNGLSRFFTNLFARYILGKPNSFLKQITKNEEEKLNLTIEDNLAELGLKDLFISLVEELKEYNISIEVQKKPFTFQFENFFFRMNASIFALLSLKSSYFRTLYSSNFKETLEQTVFISDIDLQDFKLLIKNVLHFAFKDINYSNIYTLLELSNRFDFIELEKNCQRFLLQFLVNPESENLLTYWEDDVFFPLAKPVFQEATTVYLKRLAFEKEKNPEKNERFIEFCRKCVKKKLTFQEFGFTKGTKIDNKLLSELQPMQIEYLNLFQTKVTELAELKKWNALTHLNLSWSKLCTDLDDLKEIPKLRVLNLSKLFLENNHLLKLKQLTSLESLDVSGSYSKNIGLFSGLTNLWNLNLGEWKLNDNHLESLKDLTMLQNLGLKEGDFSKAGMQFLEVFKSLKELDLSYCQLGEGCLESLKELNLRYLDISHTSGIEDLAPLIWMTSLEHLNLGEIYNIGDSEIKYLTKLNLKFLGLSKSKISEEGFVCLKKIKTLEMLDLSHTDTTDKKLQYLADLNLKYLGLSFSQITDDGIICLKKMKAIEALELSGCAITDKGLQYLTKFKFLKQLFLHDCRITDNGLNFLEEIKSLRFLNVSGCNEISRKGLLTLLMISFPLLTMHTSLDIY